MFETIFTIVFGVICIVGIWNEDKLIAFENKMFEKIKDCRKGEHR